MQPAHFTAPLKVASLLATFDHPWFIAGGWAIDLFLGQVTRAHADVEIAILREDQMAIRRHLRGWPFNQVLPQPRGGVLLPWEEEEWLHLPVHEIHALNSESDPPALEILLNEAAGDQWRFRRNLAITRPLALLGAPSPLGIPSLRPEIVLLYKAKDPRAQDEADFAHAHARLDREQRSWLKQALAACQPGHPWLAQL